MIVSLIKQKKIKKVLPKKRNIPTIHFKQRIEIEVCFYANGILSADDDDDDDYDDYDDDAEDDDSDSDNDD